MGDRMAVILLDDRSMTMAMILLKACEVYGMKKIYELVLTNSESDLCIVSMRALTFLQIFSWSEKNASYIIPPEVRIAFT